MEDDGIEPLGATLLVMPTGLQPAIGNILLNTLFGMCVLKHSSWMNPLALRPENALIRTDFSSHTRDSILVAARLLRVLSAEPGPRFLYVHTLRSTITLEQSRAF